MKQIVVGQVWIMSKMRIGLYRLLKMNLHRSATALRDLPAYPIAD